MLATYKWECSKRGTLMHNPERFFKVRKSMNHIKVVLGERHRAVKEAIEPEDSLWRKRVAAKRAARRLERKKDRRPPVHRPRRVLGLHPMKKKIVFAKLKPNKTDVGNQEKGEGKGAQIVDAQVTEDTDNTKAEATKQQG